MKSLQPGTLTTKDRPERIDVFLKKYKEQSPFVLTSGKKIVLVFNKKIASLVSKRDAAHLRGDILLDTEGNNYKISDLRKTAEFGGDADPAGLRAETAELENLKKELNNAKAKIVSPTVPIKIGTKTYDVYALESTPGTPKSDFHFVDIKGKEILWVSHKKGSVPSDFNQWGGISERETEINRHQETQAFIKAIQDKYPKKDYPSSKLYGRLIKDPKLQKWAVYGNQWSPASNFSQQNVTIVLQGRISIRQSGSTFTLTSNHVLKNGDAILGGYAPIFLVRRGDRNQFGVKRARFGIFPQKHRPNIEWI